MEVRRVRKCGPAVFIQLCSGHALTSDITAVLSRHAAGLLAIEGVEGVGEAECDGNPCIRVFVRDASVVLPREIEGIALSVVVSGSFQAPPP